jgi:glucose/arabinose dehydrogenase
MEEPLKQYTPAVVPASGMFYRGAAFPQFQGNFFFGCLKRHCIMRLVLNGSQIVLEDRMLAGRYYRIRAISEGPDGAIYFSTSNRDNRCPSGVDPNCSPSANDDSIIRLVPKS